MFLLCRCGGLRGREVVLDLLTRVNLPPCGYCLKASMTPPMPLDSRLRGNDDDGARGMTGSGTALPLWIADQVRNDVTMLMHRFHLLIPVSGTGSPSPLIPLPSRRPLQNSVEQR